MIDGVFVPAPGFTPERGDAIRALCPETNRWMGGVIDSVNVKEGWVWIVAGSYALHATPGFERIGIPCWLQGATLVRGKKIFREVYRDTDSCIYQEQL